MVSSLHLAADLLSPSGAKDPVDWVENKLNGYLWSKQKEIAKSVAENKRTIVAACHGVGKSALVARLACWWIETRQPGQAFVLTTAPTHAQVRSVLWRYINQLHASHNLRGRVNQTEWFIGGEMVALGRKPADHDDQGFQGIHQREVLIILDEAAAIPQNLWTAAEAIASNDLSRIVAIGNPDFPVGPFRDAFDSPQWNSIRISALESPNLTGEWAPLSVRDQLVSRNWVQESKERWGEDSPLYQSKVLGLFPTASEDSVIDYAKLVAAVHRDPTPDEAAEIILGIDVAGGGSDLTTIRERRGIKALRTWSKSENDSAKLTDWIAKIVIETEAAIVRIDSTGLGWGIVGSLREKCPDITVQPINASSTAFQPKRFLNSRAEMWWNGKMIIEKGDIDLSQAEGSDLLLNQLPATKWKLSASGKIQIEDKDDLKKRLGRSPDDADALLLAFYDRGGNAVAVTPLAERKIDRPSVKRIDRVQTGKGVVSGRKLEKHWQTGDTWRT